jgi:hypothetical protein
VGAAKEGGDRKIITPSPSPYWVRVGYLFSLFRLFSICLDVVLLHALGACNGSIRCTVPDLLALGASESATGK